jgi:hypothetical protein
MGIHRGYQGQKLFIVEVAADEQSIERF